MVSNTINTDSRNRWDILVEEFRGFGGTANNIIQRKGDFGLGLFPIDPAKPVELRVPDQLLVATDNIELKNGEIVLKDESSYPKGFGDWYRRFQTNYSWGAEAKNSIRAFETGLKSLPEDIKNSLSNLGLLSKDRFVGIIEDEKIFQRFILTRQINKKNNFYLMPMIELVNHSPNQSSWGMDDESIYIEGQYNEEILVRYSVADPLIRFFQYGFNCKEPIAFSTNLAINHKRGKIYVKGGINIEHLKNFKLIPHESTLIVDRPLLGSLNQPRKPRTIFRESCKSIEIINSDELFDQIHQLNRIAMITLFRNLENIKTLISQQLKEACLDQIITLSHHYGFRNPLEIKN
tara:strand:+ start:609 stop:1652 length:1044 start_codon:yes stop_codon:yes gene_type:complete